MKQTNTQPAPMLPNRNGMAAGMAAASAVGRAAQRLTLRTKVAGENFRDEHPNHRTLTDGVCGDKEEEKSGTAMPFQPRKKASDTKPSEMM